MTILKKSKAIIAAILVAVTMFVSAMPVYAATIEKKKTFLCPVAVATGRLTSDSKHQASAVTIVTSNRDKVYTNIIGKRVNSKGDFVNYHNCISVGEYTKSSGYAMIATNTSSSDYFKSITSTHLVVQKSKEYGGITLDIQY